MRLLIIALVSFLSIIARANTDTIYIPEPKTYFSVDEPGLRLMPNLSFNTNSFNSQRLGFKSLKSDLRFGLDSLPKGKDNDYTERQFLQAPWRVGIGLGPAFSYTRTRVNYEETPLLQYFRTVEYFFAQQGITYTWDEFLSDLDLRTGYFFAKPLLSGTLSKYPFFLDIQVSTSNYSYRKPSFRASLGVEFEGLWLELDGKPLRYRFFGGASYYRDFGFGLEQFLNSIQDQYLQTQFRAFFGQVGPDEPFGHEGSIGGIFGGGADYEISEDLHLIGDVFYHNDFTNQRRGGGRQNHILAMLRIIKFFSWGDKNNTKR